MTPKKIFIVEYYPQESDNLVSVQTLHPVQQTVKAASRYRGGIRNTTIRPLLLNGKQMYIVNGKRQTL